MIVLRRYGQIGLRGNLRRIFYFGFRGCKY